MKLLLILPLLLVGCTPKKEVVYVQSIEPLCEKLQKCLERTVTWNDMDNRCWIKRKNDVPFMADQRTSYIILAGCTKNFD